MYRSGLAGIKYTVPTCCENPQASALASSNEYIRFDLFFLPSTYAEALLFCSGGDDPLIFPRGDILYRSLEMAFRHLDGGRLLICLKI